MSNVFSRGMRYLKGNGVKATIKRMGKGPAPIPPKNDILDFYHFIVDREEIPLDTEAYENSKGDKVKLLNWVIPEMSAGSGGHTTIFRFVSNLEKTGAFHSRIYLHLSQSFQDNASIRAFLKEHFPLLDSRVEVYCDVSQMQYAHATIATAWTTAYYVRRFQNTISKFYFVQDFEPYFYAHGSEYEFAENTYKMGFRGITAGDWLRDLMRKEYEMTADSFHFSYDDKIYKPENKKDKRPRVFFYARPVTPRRDFELGLLAIHELWKKIPELEVIFAGWDISNYVIPFPHENLGTVTPEVLAASYVKCDMCLIISNTNLSLLPLEVMACNSVAVCSKGANSTWLVNEENSILVDYDPNQIADTMEYYFKHPDELEQIRSKGLKFAQDTSWIKEADKVKEAILRGISEDEEKLENRKS